MNYVNIFSVYIYISGAGSDIVIICTPANVDSRLSCQNKSTLRVRVNSWSTAANIVLV